MTSTTPILSLQCLSRRFGGIVAVADVTIEIPVGSCHGLIGPNGAGKSTLFLMIAGLLDPTHGCIRLDGRDVTGTSPEHRVDMGLSWTFQDGRCFSLLTPREHLDLVLGHVGGPPVSRTKTDQWLDRVGLQEHADDPLSGRTPAERKLLDIARAACGGPRILLLDEPFAGLGDAEVARVHYVLQTMRAEGITLIVIEHRLDELFAVVDRLTVLAAGAILAEGEPDDVLALPEVLDAYFGARDGS